MSAKPIIPKRLSKSKRAHVRKLKQEARAAGVVYKPGTPQ
jgi:hypothetical protein